MHLKIINAGESSFPVAWPNYNTCASYDGINMFRVPTSYDQKKGVLSWKIKPDHVSLKKLLGSPKTSALLQGSFLAHCVRNLGLGKLINGTESRAGLACIDLPDSGCIILNPSWLAAVQAFLGMTQTIQCRTQFTSPIGFPTATPSTAILLPGCK